MSDGKGALTIGRAARQAGVGVETIRFYERRGLIERPSKPQAGGFRTYDAGTIRRIRFIREAQEIGFTLREIAELLSLRADPQADCAEVRERAVAKRDEVERKAAQLRRVRDALDALIARCPGTGSLEACTILDAMGEAAVASVPPSTASSRRHGTTVRRSDSSERSKSTVKTTTFAIDGMHCDGCAETIQARLTRETGVRKVSVSFADKEARVLHDPKRVTESQLRTAIEKGGFRAAVKDR